MKKQNNDQTIGWGVIGCGGIAAKRTIPGMLLSKTAKLIAVADRDKGIAQRTASKFRCEALQSIEALLGRPDIQAVYIASPVFCHADHVRQAADAGKHILCEKPLALRVDECRAVLKHCRTRRVRLMVGFMMRFHPIHQKIKMWVESGKLGRIIMARAQLSHFHVEWNPDGSQNWRQFPEKSGGGALMDMGIHGVDLLRFFLGKEVVQVAGRAATLANPYEVEDTGVLLMTFEDGGVGIVDSTFAAKGAQHVLELYGSQGSVFVENSISQVEEGTIRTAFDGKLKQYPYRPDRNYKYAMYTRELDEMNRCILEKREPRYTARDGVIAQAIVQTGYLASQKGRTLKIPSIR